MLLVHCYRFYVYSIYVIVNAIHIRKNLELPGQKQCTLCYRLALFYRFQFERSFSYRFDRRAQLQFAKAASNKARTNNQQRNECMCTVLHLVIIGGFFSPANVFGRFFNMFLQFAHRNGYANKSKNRNDQRTRKIATTTTQFKI